PCAVVADGAGKQAQRSRRAVLDGSAEATGAGSRIAGEDAIVQDRVTGVTDSAAVGVAAVLNGDPSNEGTKTTSQFKHAGSVIAVHRETRRTGPANGKVVGDEQGTAGQFDRPIGGERDVIVRLGIGDDLPQGAWPAVG